MKKNHYYSELFTSLLGQDPTATVQRERLRTVRSFDRLGLNLSGTGDSLVLIVVFSSLRRGGQLEVQDYAILTFFFSNFWWFFGKLGEARSRLCRRQILQMYTRLKALDEIYKMYTCLHRSALKESAKFRQTFSLFCSSILNIFYLQFLQFCSNFCLLFWSKIHQLWWTFFGIFQ